MSNRLFLSIIIVPLFALSFAVYATWAIGEEEVGEDIRAPILSGTWYPGKKSALIRSVNDYLTRAKVESLEGEIKAVIVPHAGHIYSGQVAAHAYGLLKKKDFTRVIMIGPSHRVGFRGVSINLQSGYKTPLGVTRVDQALARKLIESSDQIRYIPKAHASEHSLEIQLPFLQTVLGDFHMVPILMGEQGFKACSNLARSLVGVMGNLEKTLILASSDLSHFHKYDRALELDRQFIKQVKKYDPRGLAGSLSSRMSEACGGGPVISAMLAAKELGADRSVILDYANSGDVTGDRRSVVGYLSAVLVKSSAK